jgi:pimeloyl-ACP methyl ester carboxylesterase
LDPFVTALGGSLNQRFDIVAFDPRGVGHSTPLDCHSTIEALVHTDPSPDDDAEWGKTDQAAAAFAAECAQKHAKLLPHLGTPDVARDMDQVRAALGEEQISYLGFSYGTAIGAFYAELFPKRIRAAVLDGAVDVQLSAIEISLQQGVGFEHSLAAYFEWCGMAANNCPWASAGNATPADEFARLSASVDAKALTTPSGRSVGPGEFIIGVLAPLYSGEQGYRTISASLRSAQNGDGSGLLAQTDSYLDRHPDGTYGNLQEANSAVNCLDAPVPASSELRKEAMRFIQASPTFGLATLTGLFVCAHWPVHSTPPPRPKGAGAPPILVIGTTGDPATPYTWAQALASELESGVLLTHEGEGHTAYGRGDSCIDDAVDAYFFQQTVPPDNMRCGPRTVTAPLQFPPSLYRFRMR